MATLNSEKITFTGSQGFDLAARLDLPAGKPRAYAVFAHCFTCSKDIFAASRIAGTLTGHGIAVLRFDFTGLGGSDGEFANTNFTSNVEDLLVAAEYLRQNHEAPQILIGHSLGGAAVLAVAGRIPEALCVATIGAPCDPAHVAENFKKDIEEIKAKGEAEVHLGGRPFRIQKQFIDDIEGQKLKEAIHGMKKALLVFHSPIDETVGIENASQIFLAALHPKSFISLDQADHLLRRRADALYVADVIAAWTARFIGREEEAPSRQALATEKGTVLVAEAGDGPFSQLVSVGGRHALRADEPHAVGGNDTGPTPYDYLLAGLGACTSMTMRMYADRKGIPLERVAVTLRHEKMHADDCAKCETSSGKIDRIEREIEISGDLDAESRQKLMEIADKCPVHRTLHSEVKIDSRLKE